MSQTVILKKEILEEIFERPFKDIGSDYVSLCPIHEEKTPSFYIGKSNNLVHCFGCGIGSHIIKFIENYKGVDKQDAEKLLGLALEDQFDWFQPYNHMALLEPKHYPESWLAPFKKEIHKYVTNRGFLEKTLRAAGALYDHRTQRQVFPHRDRQGALVGAIGRACRGQAPKWYYYWGYEKGRYLYEAPPIEGPEPVWIVEGVFDALWCYQHGLNAAAILGSKASKSQINEIIDNYDSVVLALDADMAGLNGCDDLYLRLRNRVEINIPMWPKWDIDIMNVNPTKLTLYNAVQREFIAQ